MAAACVPPVGHQARFCCGQWGRFNQDSGFSLCSTKGTLDAVGITGWRGAAAGAEGAGTLQKGDSKDVTRDSGGRGMIR